MKISFLLLSFLILASCSVEKKRQRQVEIPEGGIRLNERVAVVEPGQFFNVRLGVVSRVTDSDIYVLLNQTEQEEWFRRGDIHKLRHKMGGFEIGDPVMVKRFDKIVVRSGHIHVLIDNRALVLFERVSETAEIGAWFPLSWLHKIY